MRKILILSLCFLGFWYTATARPAFKVLVLYEQGGNHTEYSKAARIWLDSLASKESFAITYVYNTKSFDDEFLRNFKLIIQLDYPPYAWSPEAMKAFRAYIEEGKGAWIGFHHATLLGDFDGYSMWPWFSYFMGDIVFKSYIPGFASAEVQLEKRAHPIFKGIPEKFVVKREEWYTYNQSPRAHVEVLANANENSYVPAQVPKMGDHPVIWSNPNVKSRNLYIFMGHGADLLDNTYYKKLFKNSILWAVTPYL